MKTTKFTVISIALLVILIAGCAEQQTAKADDGRFTEIYRDNDNGRIFTVMHDNVNNVTLYTYDWGYGSGVSAIPDWQLIAPDQNNMKV